MALRVLAEEVQGAGVALDRGEAQEETEEVEDGKNEEHHLEVGFVEQVNVLLVLCFVPWAEVLVSECLFVGWDGRSEAGKAVNLFGSPFYSWIPSLGSL